MPTGELPGTLTLMLDRHLVGKIAPGTRVHAIGIYSIYQVSLQTFSAASNTQCFALYWPQVYCNKVCHAQSHAFMLLLIHVAAWQPATESTNAMYTSSQSG